MVFRIKGNTPPPTQSTATVEAVIQTQRLEIPEIPLIQPDNQSNRSSPVSHLSERDNEDPQAMKPTTLPWHTQEVAKASLASPK